MGTDEPIWAGEPGLSVRRATSADDDSSTGETLSIGSGRQPGPAARRWRRAGSGVLVVALAAAGLAWQSGWDVHPRPAVPSAPPPSLAAVPGPATLAELESLSVTALAALGFAPLPDRDRYPGLYLPHRGIYFAALTGETSVDFGRAGGGFPPGVYYLKAVCLSRHGRGSLHIQVNASRTAPRDFELSCLKTAGRVVQLHRFRLPAEGTISVRLTPDGAAIAEAGIALEVENPLIVQADNALGQDSFTNWLVTFGDQVNPGGDSVITPFGLREVATTHQKGTYRLRVACAGRGTVRAQLATAQASAAKELACREPSAVVELFVKTPADRVLIELRILPDQTAVDEAGFAYILEGLAMGIGPGH